MAESVDALVSNTSGATRAGSTPALLQTGREELPSSGQSLSLIYSKIQTNPFLFAHQ